MAERGPQRVSASACSARMTKLEARVADLEERETLCDPGLTETNLLRARVAHLDSVTEELRKLLCGQIERVEALEAYKCRCVCIACQEGNHDACYFPDDPDPDEAVGTVGVALPAKGGA